MINLSRDNRAICSGCTVCTHLCPEQCISMKKDKMGFAYPEVDGVNGVDCGLGERVCPGCKDFQMEDILYWSHMLHGVGMTACAL